MSDPDTPEPFEIVVAESEVGERLDRILSARELGPSRTTLQRWIEDGRVFVDDAIATSRTRVRLGSKVRVVPAPAPPSDAHPEDIALEVLHEDEHLIVLNKAAGMVVHPAAGHASGTLVNALLFRTVIESGADPKRPGIVHRLDKDTSGVMVVAKTSVARESLVAQFRKHSIERRYVAIAVGSPPDAIAFETTHARHPTDRKRFTGRRPEGKRACTHLRVLERLHASALVECRLETGRTHQIRVHLAEHGTPLLGDALYGKPPRDERLRQAAEILGRQALHAGVLGFIHPVTGASLRFEVEPPTDFERAHAHLIKTA